jgi:hypothetical protein
MDKNKAPAVLVHASLNDYQNALGLAQRTDPLVRASTTPAHDLVLKHALETNRLKDYPGRGKVVVRLAKRGNLVVGGYMLLSGLLVGLWGPGLGDWIIRDALHHGASRLDCFDGYLTTLYAKHGFREVLREPFFPMGTGPDIVFMRLK